MTIVEMDVDEVRAMLAPLWAKNRAHILDRLGHVRHALTSDAEPTEEEKYDVHALVGTLGTYGWPDGSALLEAIHQHLHSREPGHDTSGSRDALVRQLDELTATLSEA